MTNERRKVFVGDVQGCGDELAALVLRAERELGGDFELWIVGDVVNRGPANRRALELVRRFVDEGRGRYVLGNHEIHLLCVALGLRPLAANDSIGRLLDAPDASEWIDWLLGRPLVEAGTIAGRPFAMVHAASHPDWSLGELVGVGRALHERLAAGREAARAFLAADPASDPLRDALARLTRCRSLDADGRWSSAEPEAATAAQPWHTAWRARRHDFGLVFGHWARQGLLVAPGLRGLDTGCVHHGRGREGFLTAWVPDSGAEPIPTRDPFAAPDELFWQVGARRRYYDPARSGEPD